MEGVRAAAAATVSVGSAGSDGQWRANSEIVVFADRRGTLKPTNLPEWALGPMGLWTQDHRNHQNKKEVSFFKILACRMALPPESHAWGVQELTEIMSIEREM